MSEKESKKLPGENGGEPSPTDGAAVTSGGARATAVREPPGKPGPPPTRDVVLALGRTPDQRGFRVIRAREDRLEAGEVRPVEEGKPLNGDLVRLKPRKTAPHICDVETLMEAPAASSSRMASAGDRRSGPAQVATAAYRKNWDAIWSTNSPGSSEAN